MTAQREWLEKDYYAVLGVSPSATDKDLSRANGLLEMSTFVAIVLGTSIGTVLFSAWKNEAWKLGLLMLAVSVAGLLTSLKIPRVPASGATAPFRLDPFAEVSVGKSECLLQSSHEPSNSLASYPRYRATK